MTYSDPDGPGPAVTPRTRTRARHIFDNTYIGPTTAASILEIWGYADKYTYRTGERIALHVSTTADRWDLEIGRDGVEYTPILHRTGLVGQHHKTPEDCSVVGCGWPVALEIEIPNDWRHGAYLITLRAERDGDHVEEHALFFLRAATAAHRPRYLLVCATGTWVAYNCWGGSSAYEGITGPQRSDFSPVLSTERPWTRGFCRLPEGAPRALPQRPQPPQEAIRYPYLEWAYAYGYSKKYASAGWATYERHFARWAEAEGYDVEIVTQHDLHTEPNLLNGYKCAIFIGHDEYWSCAMRDAVEAYTDGGGRVARFAGNFLWQIRIEKEGRRQICYKYIAADADPLMGSDSAHLVSGAWEAEPVSRPGADTFGVNGLRGVYAGLGRCAGHGAGGFTVYRPNHWAFDGAHLGYGDMLGSQTRIFGYEVDGLEYTMSGGLPFPTGTDGASTDIEILALSPATNIEPDHGIWGESLYIGSADATFKAKALFGEVTPETLDNVTRGNGVVVYWRRGKGEVFTAGTCEWVAGLINRDWQVERVTRNVLDRFGGKG